jgi:hypothetical protein
VVQSLGSCLVVGLSLWMSREAMASTLPGTVAWRDRGERRCEASILHPFTLNPDEHY